MHASGIHRRMGPLLWTLACLWGGAAHAAESPGRLDPTLEPARVAQAGVLRIEQRGHGPTALVLIPGLAGGAWAWDPVVPTLASRFTLYALSLPGADGLDAVPGALIERVVADLAAMLRERGLQRPVLVGHSMGAYIALMLAVRHPDLVGGVVAVDGYPVFPPLSLQDGPQRSAAAHKMAQDLVGARSEPDYQAAIAAFVAARVSDPAMGQQVGALAARSAGEATARYLVEMLAGDLRPQLGRLRQRPLVLAATQSYRNGQTAEQIRAYYADMFRAAPAASVVLVPRSRHFVVQDQPAAVSAAIEAYVDGLAAAERPAR